MARLKINYALKTNSDKTEATLLYVMFTFNGKRYKISMGVKVSPIYWDSKTNRAIISNQQPQLLQRQMKRVNKFLESFEKELDTIILHPNHPNYCDKDIDIKGLVKVRIDILHGKERQEEEKKVITPIDFFRRVVDEMPKKVIRRTSKVIESRTVGHHQIVLKRFERFLNYNHWVASSFSIFNKNFESEMEQWMLGVEEYSANTVAATFSVMKVWLKQAEEEGLITDKSFHSWKSKGADVQHIYLDDAELEKLSII